MSDSGRGKTKGEHIMAGKKDFTKTKDRIQNTIAEATQEIMDAPVEQKTPKAYKERKTYSEQDAQEYLNAHSSAGRKGLKLPRINMAFIPENYDYIQTMARVRGETLTDFVNRIITASREENTELYQSAVEFRKRFI